MNELLASLSKAPSSTGTGTMVDDAIAMDTSLVNILTEMRQDGPKRAKKRSKVQVVPGKSLSEVDLNDQPTTSTSAKPKSKQNARDKRKKVRVDEENDENEDPNVPSLDTFGIGCYVQVVKGNFIGFYGSVVEHTEDGEVVINYFQEKVGYHGKYFILKDGDTDSRETDELKLVSGIPDEKSRFTFANLDS